jgi:hypothetical protein
MNWCAKFLTTTAIFSGLLSSAFAFDRTKPDDPNKKKQSKESKFTVPIPVGHDAQGVRLPSFDRDGKLQMMFSIGIARRVDEDHLSMEKTFLETYNKDGSLDLSVQLKTSLLDLNTRIVTSNEPATVRRQDFEVTGDKMEFNTKTHAGKFTGHVRMTIYNLQQSVGEGDAK